MLKSLPLFLALLLSACATAATREVAPAAAPSPSASATPDYRAPQALTELLARLAGEGRTPQQHGIYVETLASAAPIARLNEDTAFNPASVIKLATTFAALSRFGAQHRFRTELRADGEINARTGELQGDLILQSGGDPAFSLNDARTVGDELRRLGLRRVSGSLVVVGEFTCNENSQTDISAGVFRRQARIAFRNPTQFERIDPTAKRGRLLLSVESDELINIAQYLNAHSVNAMAEVLATHVGGPAGVQRFLIEQIGVPGNAVYISHGSGLEMNRLTPRDTVKLLRAYLNWLTARGLKPEAVLSIAGLDSGTLRDRFTESEFACSVAAKTGTLYSTDDGVAALAGVLYTRTHGPLLFAVFDMAEGRRVLHLRNVQDDFLKNLLRECGGAAAQAERDNADIELRPQSRLIAAQ